MVPSGASEEFLWDPGYRRNFPKTKIQDSGGIEKRIACLGKGPREPWKYIDFFPSSQTGTAGHDDNNGNALKHMYSAQPPS